ncbi:MAG: hypothetical protein BAA01_04570 [Bacillus thermozeamaize]|jgi:hypothetical protein|uniref:DUF3055 domain-containing protein n=1 Tax=Bacillus thermozeamaize TaxID=230954 RepID=A0A1Y3PDQ5_9BACI|nr:MAG: hypothetical protein BAA01_04570 [Bacillus thermozeamaize]
MERLYDETERCQVRFVGLLTEKARYDFCIVSTHQFFGKPLVICTQTGRSSLLGVEDATNLEHLKQVYQIPDDEEAEELSFFFKSVLPANPIYEQYSE